MNTTTSLVSSRGISAPVPGPHGPTPSRSSGGVSVVATSTSLSGTPTVPGGQASPPTPGISGLSSSASLSSSYYYYDTTCSETTVIQSGTTTVLTLTSTLSSSLVTITPSGTLVSSSPPAVSSPATAITPTPITPSLPPGFSTSPIDTTCSETTITQSGTTTVITLTSSSLPAPVPVSSSSSPVYSYPYDTTCTESTTTLTQSGTVTTLTFSVTSSFIPGNYTSQNGDSASSTFQTSTLSSILAAPAPNNGTSTSGVAARAQTPAMPTPSLNPAMAAVLDDEVAAADYGRNLRRRRQALDAAEEKAAAVAAQAEKRSGGEPAALEDGQKQAQQNQKLARWRLFARRLAAGLEYYAGMREGN
ncbi:hypothetical protein F5Y16DRAFT_396912 [Xylariaceae sp. FL0255]|nr:hypothetical protein F5Y16DRAFT_396912 [Xylariaceae sp. FL0255]